MANNGLAKKVNIFCLLAAVIAVLLFPLKKEIWYDETVSIKCSKGINPDTHSLFLNAASASSASIEQLNTAGNVFHATVLDNGNSYLYNIGLHWFTAVFGNSIGSYMLFSKLCTIALLIVFYLLANLFLKDNIFTAVALLLLATDNDIMGMSHEIRAYSLGAFFTTLAAVFFCKFTYGREKPRYLLLLGLFSVAAVLTHFLSVYIILVFLVVLLYVKKGRLFAPGNLLALALPVALLAIYFYCSFAGLVIMGKQNQQIQQAAHGFNTGMVLLKGMKFTALNFKAVFPAFYDHIAIIVPSFLLVLGLYLFAVRSAADQEQKANLHLLFLLGFSGSVFLSLLCLKSHHYTALYFRYFSFGIPFCCLFTAYALSVLFADPKVKMMLKGGLAVALLVPSFALFFLFVYRAKPQVKYNHVAIAAEIANNNVSKIEVPEWDDALLIQCFLPKGYKIDYVKSSVSGYFTLYKAGGAEKIPVIRDNT